MAGRLSTRLSSSVWVSASIQWRSSNTRRKAVLGSRATTDVYSVHRALAPLGRVENLPLRVVDGNIQQREKNRQVGFSDRPGLAVCR